MKKLFSIALCAILIICSIPAASASSCAHSYSSSPVYSSCISRSGTKYTCSKCGNSYVNYSSGFTRPSDFYFAVDGAREGDILNLKVTLGNNPGLWASRLTLNYNTSALSPISAENGTVWGSSATVTTNAESGYIRFYCQNSDLCDNTANGTIFTVSFRILDTMDNWGVSLTAGKRDNVGYTDGARDFQIINAVTQGYGDHSYDSGTISVAPTVDAAGQMLYSCTLCSATKTEAIPPLTPYLKGDTDGDGSVTMLDLFKMKLFIKQIETPDASQLSASDIDGDGQLTMVDSFELKYRISSGSWR